MFEAVVLIRESGSGILRETTTQDLSFERRVLTSSQIRVEENASSFPRSFAFALASRATPAPVAQTDSWRYEANRNKRR